MLKPMSSEKKCEYLNGRRGSLARIPGYMVTFCQAQTTKLRLNATAYIITKTSLSVCQKPSGT